MESIIVFICRKLTILSYSHRFEPEMHVNSENAGGRNERKCSRFIRRWFIIEGYRENTGEGLSSKDIARTPEVGTSESVRDLSGDGLSSKDKVYIPSI